MSLNNVVVVIPSFRSDKKMLRNTIESISASRGVTISDVVIVDYGTPLRILKELKEECKKLEILRLTEDPGLQYMRAIGAYYASKNCKADIVVFVDSDVIVLPSTIRKIVAPLNQSNVASSAPIVVNLGGIIPWITSACDCSCFPLWEIPLIKKVPFLPRNLALTAFNPGACFAVKVDALKEIGYCSKDMRFWFEDMDIALRFWRKGYFVVTVLDALAVHLYGGSRRGLNVEDYYRRMVEELYIGRLRCIFRNYSFLDFLKGWLLLSLEYMRFHVLKAMKFKGYEKYRCKYALKGMIKGLASLKGVQRSLHVCKYPEILNDFFKHSLGVHVRMMLKIVDFEQYARTLVSLIEPLIEEYCELSLKLSDDSGK